jgi:hypothetical protein
MPFIAILCTYQSADHAIAGGRYEVFDDVDKLLAWLSEDP